MNLRRIFKLSTGLLALLLLACSGGSETETPSGTVVAPTETQAPATATPTPVPTLAPPAPLAWSQCGGFQCASFEVPVDYTKPDGAKLTLSLIRQPAKGDPGSKIGSLFVNPGGPGGSAVSFLRSWAPLLPRDIQNQFDIVAFDPRGVNESTPLSCQDNVTKLIALPPNPTTDDDWRQINEETKRFTDLCAQRGGGSLPFYGTENVARDMDRLRQAAGDEKLTYFGYSYGTTIGQGYIDLFPDKVRAMVLDGVVDIALPADELTLEQTLGFEAAYSRFLADCRTRGCLTASRGDPEAAINGLIEKAKTSPIPSSMADRPAGAGEIVYAIIGSLYAKSQWVGLGASLERAFNGDGSGIIRLADQFVGRRPDGSFDNSVPMNNAVNCLDDVFNRDPAHYRALSQQFATLAPHFGATTGQGGLACALWGATTRPMRTPTGAGAPPILLIGNTGDPATPYKWAVGASKRLPSSLLLTYDGEGHTAYRTQGSLCVDDMVNAYLLTLQMPAAGASCGNAGIAPSPAVDFVPPANVGAAPPTPSATVTPRP